MTRPNFRDTLAEELPKILKGLKYPGEIVGKVSPGIINPRTKSLHIVVSSIYYKKTKGSKERKRLDRLIREIFHQLDQGFELPKTTEWAVINEKGLSLASFGQGVTSPSLS
jgi:hypothetical protein